jgi:HlyD family secretion protein
MTVWGVGTELEGAIVAQGELRVETKSKPVQHREGGVVGAIFVKNGDVVKAQQPLIRLDQTTQEASLTIVDSQLLEFLARRARLLAVRDEKTSVIFPDLVLERAADDTELDEVVTGQRNLFESRLSGYRQQRAQLIERIAQLENEIRASQARRKGFDTQLESIEEEVRMQQDLLDRGLSIRSRVEGFRREGARIDGEIGALLSDEARLRRQIQETKIEITRLREARREEAISELRDVETRIAELRQRMIVATDALKKIELRAPSDGVVEDLSVFAVGAVVAPGEPVMTIVPVADRLILEAKVATTDRDKVYLSQPTRVLFSAFNRNTTPELNGEVFTISADRKIDEVTGAPYFGVEILLTEEERNRLGDENELVPGMPAEIYIQTEARTPLNYLLKPILDNFEPAFKQ